MFTINQISKIHAKVKTGADFPQYAQELKVLGVEYYEHHVKDGRNKYFGAAGFSLTGEAKYPAIEIAAVASVKLLENALTIHQAGKTDYITFCRQAADAGVEKWKVNMVEMNCIYYDKSNNTLVTELIPQP